MRRLRRPFGAPFEAERTGQAGLIEADYNLQIADKKAGAILKEEGARAQTYAQKVAAFGGDARAAAQVASSENIGDMENLKVLGGNALVNIDEGTGGRK
jgi:hypothetical protein